MLLAWRGVVGRTDRAGGVGDSRDRISCYGLISYLYDLKQDPDLVVAPSDVVLLPVAERLFRLLPVGDCKA